MLCLKKIQNIQLQTRLKISFDKRSESVSKCMSLCNHSTMSMMQGQFLRRVQLA